MVVLLGEPSLTGVLVRELLARNIDVTASRGDLLARPSEGERTIIVAEGARDEREVLEDAVRSVELWGGSVVYATGRDLDDPVIVGLRRRGVPYTIVRSGGLVELPSTTSSSFVLVPSDLERVPFSTTDDLARPVAELIRQGRIGSGAVVDVTSHAGAVDWAVALREAGARSVVVPRWIARMAGWIGVLRLDVVGRKVQFVSGRGSARIAGRLTALTS